MPQWIEQAWEYTEGKINRTHKRIGDSFPHVCLNGKYDAAETDYWTNGFWPGILWLMYRETGTASFREMAESCEEKLDEPLQEYDQLHHDNGFIWSLSAVANYKTTGNRMSRRRGLIAASHLASRFNLMGKFIRAWPGQGNEGWCIIDCLMNLGLLYWASEELEDPRYRHLAAAYADTALREFVRPDGSAHHIVCFDPHTGARTGALGGQGYSPESAWSRGTAWAIYGFALSYRYTKEAKYLEAAKKVAQFFLRNLPDDRVPPWDFRAPADQIWAKDSTAAACAASGLLEIALLTDGEEAAYYRESSSHILKSLFEHYTPENPDEEALIVKGTGSYPNGSYVEVPIIYGDYFFVEGLLKLRGRSELFW